MRDRPDLTRTSDVHEATTRSNLTSSFADSVAGAFLRPGRSTVREQAAATLFVGGLLIAALGLGASAILRRSAGNR